MPYHLPSTPFKATGMNHPMSLGRNCAPARHVRGCDNICEVLDSREVPPEDLQEIWDDLVLRYGRPNEVEVL